MYTGRHDNRWVNAANVDVWRWWGWWWEGWGAGGVCVCGGGPLGSTPEEWRRACRHTSSIHALGSGSHIYIYTPVWDCVCTIYKCICLFIHTYKYICMCASWCVWATYVDHVPPALRLAAEQRLVVGQPGVVDAHVHALVQGLDRREHGQDLLLVAQVTLVRDQRADVAGALTFCCQFLKKRESDLLWVRAPAEEDKRITLYGWPRMPQRGWHTDCADDLFLLLFVHVKPE